MQKHIIKFVEVSELPSEIANFKVHAFTEKQSEKDHLAITLGDIKFNQILFLQEFTHNASLENLFLA